MPWRNRQAVGLFYRALNDPAGHPKGCERGTGQVRLLSARPRGERDVRRGGFPTPSIREAPDSDRPAAIATRPPTPRLGLGARDVHTFSPLPGFRRSMEKRKLRDERSAARNSIWCLSVSALSECPGASDATRGPARKCHPSSARSRLGPRAGGQEARSSWAGGVEVEGT